MRRVQIENPGRTERKVSNRVGGKKADVLKEAGEYMLALVWFERRTGRRSGKPYLQCRFVVVSGPSKGRGFFCPVSVDMTATPAKRRWEVWMEQVGCEEEIDLDDDATIERVFKGEPFKAKVKLITRDGYDNTDLDRFIYPRLYTDEDRAGIKAWKDEWNSRGWAHRDPSDPGPSDSDAPSGAQPQWSEGSGFGDEEGSDVPF